jgi:intergrase/recombinase
MPTIEASLQRPPVADESVRRWRFEQLVEAGYPEHVAESLSGRSDVDLHLAVSLLTQGCPRATALRILL